MKTPQSAFRCGLVFLTAAVVTAGCAGPAAHFPRGPYIAADYEQVYVTGSHIPVLMPKSPSVRRLPSISPLVVLTPEEMQRITAPTPFPMH